MTGTDFDREERFHQVAAGYSRRDRGAVWQLVAGGDPPLDGRRALARAFVEHPPWMFRADTRWWVTAALVVGVVIAASNVVFLVIGVNIVQALAGIACGASIAANATRHRRRRPQVEVGLRQSREILGMLPLATTDDHMNG